MLCTQVIEPSKVSRDLSIRLYSPNKVLVAAILGGIAGGCVLHWLNLKALNYDQKANQTFVWSVILFVILPVFSLVTHISLTGGSGAIAAGYMMDAKRTYGDVYKNHAEQQGKVGGWLATIGISLASLVISVVIIFSISLLIALAVYR